MVIVMSTDTEIAKKAKKSFEKDTAAHALVSLMVQDEFSDMPEAYIAEQADLTLEEYNAYMSDPHFLRWAAKKMQDLYVKKLPALLNTMFQQALDGKGRQQKMLLDFMKITQKEEETKSPNIVIVNNIPNPDSRNDNHTDAIDVTEGVR